MRTFVLGDIHGGFKALKQVLERSDFDYENDKLISLGDLCDGWSETRNAVEEIQKIKNLVYIKGNHDAWTLEALSTRYRMKLKDSIYQEAYEVSKKWYDSTFFSNPSKGMSWLAHGGRATQESYSEDLEGIANALTFMDSGLLYYIDEENRLFSHAGPNPYMIFEKTPEEEFYWNREFWYLAWSGKNPGKNWTEAYIGHTPTLNFPSNKEDCTKPIKRMNVWNIDTGACFNGKLSMMEINTKELFQSDVVRKLYPDEKGRMGVTYNEKPKI